MEIDPQKRELWREAFGDADDFIEAFFEKAYAPERCRCLTAEGELAAMLYWFDGIFRGRKTAYIYAVATKEKFRGRGLCTRLMAETHRQLKSEGYAAAMLKPGSEKLRRMYAKMGYRDCCTAAEFSCRAGTAVPIRAVTAGEYAILRRRYLPADGVIQEGESLRFLDALAKLYAGDNVLLAASAEGETLNGLELLGDRNAAPGIVGALGCKAGRFRTPGGEGPFAMFCPLEADLPAPGYLGLVFD